MNTYDIEVSFKSEFISIMPKAASIRENQAKNCAIVILDLKTVESNQPILQLLVRRLSIFKLYCSDALIPYVDKKINLINSML